MARVIAITLVKQHTLGAPDQTSSRSKAQNTVRKQASEKKASGKKEPDKKFGGNT